MSKLWVGSATDVGMVRSNNQDQLLVVNGLYAVADGMGGHAAGEVASATAVRALRAAFEASNDRSEESLLSAAQAANRAVWEQAQSHRAMHGMGTTLVALAVIERKDGTSGLAIAHIGDSRAYRYRDGQLSQLTVDHSYVQELIDDGQISQAQAAVHPQRHVLTRALGVEPSVDIDLLALDPRHGDRYLLCSDGLPREANDTEIAGVLRRFPDPSDAARELVDLANSRGGSDNITVVVVDVLPNGTVPDAVITVASVERAFDSNDLDGTAPLDTSATGGAVATATRPVETVPAPKTSGSRDEAALRRPGDGRQATPARSRLVTWRFASFLAAVCVVIGGSIAALAWYARSTYFVSLSHGNITIFQGRPGGVLWFGPTVAERTSYTKSSVLPYELVELHAGQLEPSLQRARKYVSDLVAEKVEAERAVPSYAKGAPRSTKARTSARRPSKAATAGTARVPATARVQPTRETTSAS